MGATSRDIKEWLGKKILQSGVDQQDFAKAVGSSRPTVSRIVNNPQHNSQFEVIYNLIAEISGKFPFQIKGNELLSNLGDHVNEEIVSKFAAEVQGMDGDDVGLVFQFLAILKHRNLLEPIQLGALIGALALLHDKVMGFLRETKLAELPGARSGEKDSMNNFPN